MTLLWLLLDGDLSTQPGGGGFGAVMSKEHTQRYKPGDLGPGYRPAYESHLRKQKSGR